MGVSQQKKMGHLSRVLSLDGFKMNKIVVVHVAHPGFLGFLILGEKNEKYRFTSVLDCIFASGIHRENAYFHGNFEQNKSKCYFNHVIERIYTTLRKVIFLRGGWFLFSL